MRPITGDRVTRDYGWRGYSMDDSYITPRYYTGLYSGLGGYGGYTSRLGGNYGSGYYKPSYCPSNAIGYLGGGGGGRYSYLSHEEPISSVPRYYSTKGVDRYAGAAPRYTSRLLDSLALAASVISSTKHICTSSV